MSIKQQIKFKDKINFEEDQQDLVDKTASIQSLADQIQMLEGLNSRIETSENNLKDLKKEHDRLSGEVIPTMMAEMGLAHLKLADGSTVDVKPNYSANISIANREKAYQWLRENGLGDIIKNEISVSFGRNEDNKACLLYTSPSPRDGLLSRMPSSA